MCNHTQQLTTKQELSGREFDKRRLRDEVKWRVEFRKLLKRQMKALLKAIDEAPTPTIVLDELNKYINPFELKAMYAYLYTTQGQKYYLATQRALKNKSVYQFDTKATIPDDDKYWQDMADFIDGKIASTINSVNETTKKEAQKVIREVIEEGVRMGYSIPQMKKMLNQKIPEAWRKMGAFRPELIARTETITMSNHASFLGAEGLEEDLDKVWLAFIDKRTRLAHIQADRQVAPMNGHFIVGGEQMSYPGDPDASKANRCNCRCTLVYQTKDERNY